MPQIFDRKTFFTYARRAPFGNRMTQKQVDGLEAILDRWEREFSYLDIRFLAYILATAFHETGGRMQPVREGFASSDAQAAKILKNRIYAAPDERTGKRYYGRGHVQLTWYANYDKMGKLLGLDLVNNPDLALDPEVSTRILFEGMLKGVSGRGDFTGKSLETYFNATTDDPVGARRIINGTDKAQLIAGYHKTFLDALTTAKEAEITGRPDDVPDRAPVADGANLFTDKTMLGVMTAGGGGAAASVFGAINSPYALGAFAIVAMIIAVGLYLAVKGRTEIKKKAGA